MKHNRTEVLPAELLRITFWVREIPLDKASSNSGVLSSRMQALANEQAQLLHMCGSMTELENILFENS